MPDDAEEAVAGQDPDWRTPAGLLMSRSTLVRIATTCPMYSPALPNQQRVRVVRNIV